MLNKKSAVMCAAGVLTMVGLGSGIAWSAAQTPTINDSMTKVMSVEAQTIWDISSKAFNKRGDGLDARKISAADWKFLGESARKIKERATLLATAKTLVVAAPNEQVLGEDASKGGVKKTWDAANRKQIKALIDARPKLFSEHAWTLARSMEALEKASKTKDIKTVYRVSANLDEDCDGCHKPFWGTDDPPPPPKTGIPVIKGL